MKKAVYGGAYMIKEYSLAIAKRQIFTYAIKLFMVYIGVALAINAFVEAFFVEVNPGVLWRFPAICVAVAFGISFIPKRWIKWLLSVALIVGYVLFQGIQTIIDGVQIAILRISDMYYGYTTYGNYNLLYANADITGGNLESLEGLLCVIIVLMVAVLYLATMKRVNSGVHLVLTAPFFLSRLIVGIKPGITIIWMLMYYFAMVCMFRADVRTVVQAKKGTNAYESESTANTSAQVGVFVMVLFSIIAVVYSFARPGHEYRDDARVDKLMNQVVEYVRNFSFDDIRSLFEKRGDAAVSFNQSELGTSGSVDPGDDVIMKITIPGDMIDTIYIKQAVKYIYYSGAESESGYSRWDPADHLQGDMLLRLFGGDASDIYNLQYRALLRYNTEHGGNGRMRTFAIEKLLRGDESTYMPYFASLSEGVDMDGITIQNSDSAITYFDVLDMRGILGISCAELSRYGAEAKDRVVSLGDRFEEYESFVYEYEQYVFVPSDLDRFEEEFGDRSFSSLDACLAYVRDYLSGGFEYTLSPGETPEGEDFVEHFLFESKKGYCSYFASAATLMLREFGYPARYVEGFMINASRQLDGNVDSIFEVEVSEERGHAWVEVFVEDYGWVIFDPTPAGNQAYVSRGDVDMVSQGITTGEREEMTTAGERETTEELPEVETSGVESETTAIAAETGRKIDMSWLRYVILAISIPAVIYLIFYRKAKKEKRIEALVSSEESIEKVKAVSEMMSKLVKVLKIEMYDYETRMRQSQKVYEKLVEYLGTSEYKYDVLDIWNVYRVIDMGKYSNKAPDKEKTERAAEVLMSINKDIYEKNNLCVKYVIKYGKCLYLKNK